MRSRAVVIGVGNPWRRDDGVGWAVAADAGRLLGPVVEIVTVDGEPSRLLDAWTSADLAVVVDAIRTGARPGTIHVWAGGAGPARVARTTGTHGLGLADAVVLGHALGRLPAHLVVVAVEADDTAAGHGLSCAVGAALPEATLVVAGTVARWRSTGRPSDDVERLVDLS